MDIPSDIVPPPEIDFLALASTIKTRNQYNRYIRNLSNPNFSPVQRGGLTITAYELNELRTASKAINRERKFRLEKLALLPFKGGEGSALDRSVVDTSVESLKMHKTVPKSFSSLKALEHFRLSIVNQRDFNARDKTLQNNYIEAIMKNITDKELADALINKVKQYSPSEFYYIYMSSPISIGFVYGPADEASIYARIDTYL